MLLPHLCGSFVGGGARFWESETMKYTQGSSIGMGLRTWAEEVLEEARDAHAALELEAVPLVVPCRSRCHDRVWEK